MIEFVEECRQEWKRLSVPDPIANEMAADLSADIEEAEAEGGSAEDVLGSSLFDPRRFAAAWAGARGVIGPNLVVVPPQPSERVPRSWRRVALVAAATCLLTVTALAGAALIVGRHSSAVAAPVGKMLKVPGTSQLVNPGPAAPPYRIFVHGESLVAPDAQLIAILAFVLLLVAIVGVGAVLLFWSPWFRRESHGQLR